MENEKYYNGGEIVIFKTLTLFKIVYPTLITSFSI